MLGSAPVTQVANACEEPQSNAPPAMHHTERAALVGSAPTPDLWAREADCAGHFSSAKAGDKAAFWHFMEAFN
jgi:hypothetical protein